MIELVAVGRYPTAVEAHVARLALESEGIYVFIANENHDLTEEPVWPSGGVEVRVRKSDASRAVAVLAGESDSDEP